MSDKRELEALIRFWKDSLAEHRLLMNPSTVYLVEQTVKALEELKETKEVLNGNHREADENTSEGSGQSSR